MGMLDGLGVRGISMPGFTGIGTGLLNVLLVFLVVAALTFIGYYIWDSRRYRYKIEIFENLGGTRYVKTGVDRARVVKVGDSGEEILFLKKRKKIISAYGRKMGNNLLWFAVGQDGYWYNITLGDLDGEQGMLDIEPIDKDMRYAYTSLRKVANQEYNKQKFMDKYGAVVMNGIFLIIIIIGIGYLLTRMGDVAGVLGNSLNTMKELAQTNKEVLNALDNICSNSGIRGA